MFRKDRLHHPPGAQVPRRQNQGIAADIFEGDTLLFRQGMPETGDQHRLVGHDGEEIEVFRRIEQRSHGKIRLARAQSLQSGLARHVVQFQFHPGMLRHKLFDVFRQHIQ